MRKLSDKTQIAYIRAVPASWARFAGPLAPITATAEDVRPVSIAPGRRWHGSAISINPRPHHGAPKFFFEATDRPTGVGDQDGARCGSSTSCRSCSSRPRR